MIEVPPHMVAATRLGVAKEAGQVLVVVLDKTLRRRSLWLADDRGMRACAKRYVYKDAGSDHGVVKLTALSARPIYRSASPIVHEHHYEVVEHLGNEDERVRCVPLIEAERLGVPIIEWPLVHSENVVTWAPGLWALHSG